MKPLFGIALALFLAVSIELPGTAIAGDQAWVEIRKDLFGPDRVEIDDGSVRLFGPKQADDAALVPISILINSDLVRAAKRLVLVIDENPAPVAATLTFGEAYRTGGEIGDRSIATRIRLNAMSKVRAVLETADGKLYGGSQFIAGSGGCTSTSLKDMDEAMTRMGETRLAVKADATRGPLWHELQLQIRHPNLSGMQIDARAGTFTQVLYVERIKLEVAGAKLVEIEGGISISEDPHFRMSFAQKGEAKANVMVRDSKGAVYEATASF